MNIQIQWKTRMKYVAISIMSGILAGCAQQSTYAPPENAIGVPTIPGINIIEQQNSAATEAVASVGMNVPVSNDLPPGTNIVVKQHDDRTIQEYRLYGHIYSIKITPTNGEPYYLVATKTGGNFIRADGPRLLVPEWRFAE